MGVDGQYSPLDAVGQPRQQGPAQTNGCTRAQAFSLPSGSIAERDVDTIILEISLLIGHIRDQFFDYQMDLRRLRDGSIDAAYVGSTLAPEEVADEEGFSVLSWAGDHFQIPTVGIAVDPAHIRLDDPALQALVRANRRQSS